eukprot:XP_024307389.1 uncharacterized protein LOC112268232 [Homo sapiens]
MPCPGPLASPFRRPAPSVTLCLSNFSGFLCPQECAGATGRSGQAFWGVNALCQWRMELVDTSPGFLACKWDGARKVLHHPSQVPGGQAQLSTRAPQDNVSPLSCAISQRTFSQPELGAQRSWGCWAFKRVWISVKSASWRNGGLKATLKEEWGSANSRRVSIQAPITPLTHGIRASHLLLCR